VFKDKVPELHLVPAAGGGARKVAGKVWVLFRWFADSKRLLVFEVAHKDKEKNTYSGHLAILDADTGKSKALAAVAALQDFHLDLAPDNRKALFTALRAGNAGADVTRGTESTLKLFELDLASGAVRATGTEANYAIYSPGGKKVLLGRPPAGFNLEAVKLEVADADLSNPVVVAPEAYKPLAIGGEGRAFPGWVNERTVFFFHNKRVYGTEGKGMALMTVGADGKGRRCVQPFLDLEAVKDGT
jgi:hypothetical protein